MPKVLDASCTHVKPDGTRCRARPRPGRPFCIFHDPEMAERGAEARRTGGENRCRPAATLPPDTPDLPLRTVDDIAAALAVTMNQVRTGKLAVQVGNCLGVLAGVLLKAIEGSDLERRLAALEARQNATNGRVHR